MDRKPVRLEVARPCEMLSRMASRAGENARVTVGCRGGGGDTQTAVPGRAIGAPARTYASPSKPKIVTMMSGALSLAQRLTLLARTMLPRPVTKTRTTTYIYRLLSRFSSSSATVRNKKQTVLLQWRIVKESQIVLSILQQWTGSLAYYRYRRPKPCETDHAGFAHLCRTVNAGVTG
jgi:hypothetical protein